MVGRLREVDVRRRERAADVGHDDPVGGVRSVRGAVGDIDTRSRGEVAPCSCEAVDHGPAQVRVDHARLGHGSGDRHRLRPVGAAVR